MNWSKFIAVEVCIAASVVMSGYYTKFLNEIQSFKVVVERQNRHTTDMLSQQQQEL